MPQIISINQFSFSFVTWNGKKLTLSFLHISVDPNFLVRYHARYPSYSHSLRVLGGPSSFRTGREWQRERERERERESCVETTGAKRDTEARRESQFSRKLANFMTFFFCFFLFFFNDRWKECYYNTYKKEIKSKFWIIHL